MAWTLKKWALSALIISHLAALVVWNVPQCALRERYLGAIRPYMLCTGLAQDWQMFAPDPCKSAIVLEGLTVDRFGVARSFTFPSLAQLSPLTKIPLFRHAKYAGTMGLASVRAQREFAARHVLRSLDLAAESYPVDVQLHYKIWPTPPPGSPPGEVPLQAENSVIETYKFPSREEAMP